MYMLFCESGLGGEDGREETRSRSLAVGASLCLRSIQAASSPAFW